MDALALILSIAAIALAIATRRRGAHKAPDLSGRITELERAERRRTQREAERS